MLLPAASRISNLNAQQLIYQKVGIRQCCVPRDVQKIIVILPKIRMSVPENLSLVQMYNFH